ncbi:hypothetical protein NG796_05540 [Laspinema sp. A4]|uniref:hypothetical protein n=1 Tax=Laspinema sp. D2d TaxID=2953686 RepID=UPI0021BAEAE2|nr:hypothetical protein [Laspinema sp. D2d]MCT7982754.1 hypothetical protein [Laspinema sp. D2d]
MDKTPIMNAQSPSLNPPQTPPPQTELEKAAQDFGRALVVYLAWKSAGLLDR